MTGARIALEKFDGDVAAGMEESADFKRGFADGVAAADASHAAALASSIKGISTTLDDMAFGFQEARNHVLARIHPLIAQLAETALPEIIHETFGAHLSEVIASRFEDLAAAPINIAIAPDLVSVIGQSHHDTHFVFSADPSLQAGQALIRQNDTHVLLDLPALLAALQTALHGLEQPERKNANG